MVLQAQKSKSLAEDSLDVSKMNFEDNMLDVESIQADLSIDNNDV